MSGMMCFGGDAYVGNYGAVALDDVRTVMTFQHHVEIHQNPLILIFVSGAAHLLETHRCNTRVTHQLLSETQTSVFVCVDLKKPPGPGSINRPPSQLPDFLIVKKQQLKGVFNGRLV